MRSLKRPLGETIPPNALARYGPLSNFARFFTSKDSREGRRVSISNVAQLLLQIPMECDCPKSSRPLIPAPQLTRGPGIMLPFLFLGPQETP